MKITSTIIPAQPGFEVVTFIAEPNAQASFAEFTAIVAWEVRTDPEPGCGEEDPEKMPYVDVYPITTGGRVIHAHVRQPDGRVIKANMEEYDNVEDWLETQITSLESIRKWGEKGVT
jgi:hypothetical protein